MHTKREFFDFTLITIKAIIEISFLIGSVLLALYLISIGYAPFFTFSETVWIIILVFLLGLLLILFFGFILFFPGLYLRDILFNISLKLIEKEQQKVFHFLFFDRKPNIKILIFFFAFPFVINYILLFIYLLYLKKLFSLIVFISLIIYTFFWIIALSIIFSKYKIEIKNKIKIYFHAAVTGYLAFISFWIGFLVFINLIKITSKLDYLWLLIPGIFSIFSIYIISITEENFIKVFSVILIIFPIAILLVFGKIDIIYKTPMKLLHLGNVRITLVLDEKYAKLLKKEICKQINSQNRTLCNLLNKSILEGFLLFRTPKGYLIEIKNPHIQKSNIEYRLTLFIKENFINLTFFENTQPNNPLQRIRHTAGPLSLGVRKKCKIKLEFQNLKRRIFYGEFRYFK